MASTHRYWIRHGLTKRSLALIEVWCVAPPPIRIFIQGGRDRDGFVTCHILFFIFYSFLLSIFYAFMTDTIPAHPVRCRM